MLVGALACDREDVTDPIEDALSDELSPGSSLGKADSAQVVGLSTSVDKYDTRAWVVRNAWEDTDTAEARKAGPAWSADSGLNWDEKYSAWIESMDIVVGFEGHKTLIITTPWGKEIEAPMLDCADVALTLRTAFAAWYGLPFFLTAYDSDGTAVYFGHFGIRTASGRWGNAPRFSVSYSDFSNDPPAPGGAWPHDSRLRERGVQSGDEQEFLGEGARTGAYLDEIHLNKRAAELTRWILVYFGSQHLADSHNTYNLTPEALRPGDALLLRWAAQGIGHTMLTVHRDEAEGGQFDVEMVAGTLPPRQPRWMSSVEATNELTSDWGGGTGYGTYGGGVKRFRVAKKSGGKWINTWMAADEASWINDQDTDAIEARPGQFASLLAQVDPEARIDALLDVVEAKRDHLRNFPASCAAREGREQAFAAIYEVAEDYLGLSVAEVDERYRTLEDYVFAELAYTESKTCCWNSTNSSMYDSIMALNERMIVEAGDACVEPLVFKAVDGGYDAFEAEAGPGWVQWSEDELCPQRDVKNDVEVDHAWTPWCELHPPTIALGGRDIARGELDEYVVTAETAGTWRVTTTGTGDVDLGVQIGRTPTQSDAICWTLGITANETCELSVHPGDEVHIAIDAWKDSSYEANYAVLP